MPSGRAKVRQDNVLMGPGAVLDCLLPRRCLLCRARSAANLCTACDADLPANMEACARCGLALDFPWSGGPGDEPLQGLCGACIARPPPFDSTVAALRYEFPVTVLVQRFKFNRSLACGAVLSNRLLRALEGLSGDAREPVGLIVPVPLHPLRQFRRVYNQAEVLARDVGRALRIPVAPGALRRIRRTPAQSGLSAQERRKNLGGAFAPRHELHGRVALVDDVMTTGATVGECTRALKQAGAESVSVWVAARAH